MLLIIRALQLKQTHNVEEEQKRQKNLILIAMTYIVYSIVERTFTSFEYRFYLLVIMTMGGLFAKEKGYFDQTLSRLMEMLGQKKIA